MKCIDKIYLCTRNRKTFQAFLWTTYALLCRRNPDISLYSSCMSQTIGIFGPNRQAHRGRYINTDSCSVSWQPPSSDLPYFHLRNKNTICRRNQPKFVARAGSRRSAATFRYWWPNGSPIEIDTFPVAELAGCGRTPKSATGNALPIIKAESRCSIRFFSLSKTRPRFSFQSRYTFSCRGRSRRV